MKKKVFTALGLMSGTSLDGVDLSIIKTDGHGEFTPILDDYYEFDQKLQKKILDLRDRLSVSQDFQKYSSDLDKLDREYTLFNSKIINKSLNNFKGKIDLIGFHGQTIFHDSSKKISLQLGNGKLLSQILKSIVVNDFRKKDLLNGGQGAPLTPIYHKLLFDNKFKKLNNFKSVNIINIGGIANITQIANENELGFKHIYAYDIGPGNCLIDSWVRKNSKKKFDLKGEIAKSGKINDLILNQAIDNFIINNYDRSLDIKDFDVSFVKGLSFEDGCATLTKFSAYLIAEGIKYLSNLNNISNNINLVCGGGRKNIFLIELINEFLDNKEKELKNIDEFDLNGDFIESQAFGYLAVRSYLKLPISFPNTTRCKSPTLGGTLNKNF